MGILQILLFFFFWRLSSKLLKQGYLAERLKSSFRKFYGRYGDLIRQYEVSLSRMLNDILILDQQWLPNQSDFPPISWPWYRAWPSPIMSGFHGAFATGVACQQGTLTLPDTWFRPPFWDLLVLQLLRPNSSNLPCLYSTFHIEYPLVLSRFCFKVPGKGAFFFSSVWQMYIRDFIFEIWIEGKTEVPRDVRNSKVRKQDKFRRDWSQHRTLTSPKVGQDQVSGGVSVLFWHAAPVANILWKPLAIR